MLPKKHRIDKKLFKEVFGVGKNYYGGLVSLKITPVDDKNIRFTFVAPIKTAKNAVTRNKLKRRARYITAKLLSSFKTNIAVIVFFKKGSEKLDFKELEKELTTAYKKAGILQY